MTYHRVIVEPTGYRVGLTTDGRDFDPRGPVWKAPREAIDYALALNHPYVSPLRVPAGRSGSHPVAPLRGGRAERPAGARNGTPGSPGE